MSDKYLRLTPRDCSSCFMIDWALRSAVTVEDGLWGGGRLGVWEGGGTERASISVLLTLLLLLLLPLLGLIVLSLRDSLCRSCGERRDTSRDNEGGGAEVHLERKGEEEV